MFGGKKAALTSLKEKILDTRTYMYGVQKSCGYGLFANGAYTFVGIEEEPRIGVGGY